ncbi:MAG: hypothetical protein GY760_14020 [Deltaproteobacteria bacterium]|nr:hypothetical protein [Deltaproteobacteria bacterium]
MPDLLKHTKETSLSISTLLNDLDKYGWNGNRKAGPIMFTLDKIDGEIKEFKRNIKALMKEIEDQTPSCKNCKYKVDGICKKRQSPESVWCSWWKLKTIKEIKVGSK